MVVSSFNLRGKRARRVLLLTLALSIFAMLAYGANGAMAVMTAFTSDGETSYENGSTGILSVDDENDAPVVNVTESTVTVNEGQEATNTITWFDADVGDEVTITASAGTVVDNKDGTMSWSFKTVDGPNDGQIVIITAKDSENVEDTTTFRLIVNNVAPVVDAGEDQTSIAGNTVNFKGSFTDAGILDTHTVEWDFGDGSKITGTLTPSHTFYNEDTYTVTLKVKDKDGGTEEDTLVVVVKPIAAAIDINPKTLNLNSKGKWITAYIELPEGYDAGKIIAAYIQANGVVSAINNPKYGFVKKLGLEDRNGNGLLELMVKFDRKAIQDILGAGGLTTLTITGGVMHNGGLARYKGSDTIKVIQAKVPPKGIQPAKDPSSRTNNEPVGSYSSYSNKPGNNPDNELGNNLGNRSNTNAGSESGINPNNNADSNTNHNPSGNPNNNPDSKPGDNPNNETDNSSNNNPGNNREDKLDNSMNKQVNNPGDNSGANSDKSSVNDRDNNSKDKDNMGKNAGRIDNNSAEGKKK